MINKLVRFVIAKGGNKNMAHRRILGIPIFIIMFVILGYISLFSNETMTIRIMLGCTSLIILWVGLSLPFDKEG